MLTWKEFINTKARERCRCYSSYSCDLVALAGRLVHKARIPKHIRVHKMSCSAIGTTAKKLGALVARRT
jgi:hypothetical protein